MAGLTNQIENDIKIYDIITEEGERKLLSISNKLDIDKFVYAGKNHYTMTFYDTADNLLTRTGILLYKTQENNGYFFKIEKLSFLPSVSKLHKTKIFEHQVTAKDTPKSQAFYLINGITSLFSTTFNIDLENVVRVAVPKLSIDIDGTEFKGFKGNGFKCLIEFQKVKYHNFVTKRKYTNLEMKVDHVSPKQFAKDYEMFLTSLEKYCKDILPKTEARFDYGNKITKPLVKVSKTKQKEQKNAKKMKVENSIED